MPIFSTNEDSHSHSNGTSAIANGFFDDMMDSTTTVKDEVKIEKKNKKKKKKSKENQKKSKERKVHDIEGQFSGLPMPNFGGVAMTDNMNFKSGKIKVES